MDLGLALAGLIVGVVVGLTGMGGGALMTPILVLVFHIQPLAAVSSDLVASMFMKPVGAAVHIRRGTVNWELVKWLCVGSVPCAFAGVFVLRALGAADLQGVVKQALGYALLLAALGLIVKTYMALRERVHRRSQGLPIDTGSVPPPLKAKILPTVAIGAVGGLVVGMTSVGSGSLIIIALLMLYPVLKANQLVGTDLVQAVPLVAAAALGHVLFGDFQLGITASLLVGCIPGVYIGARFSSQAPGGIIRRALTLVLLASGLKLVGVSTTALAWILLVTVVVGSLAWMQVRRSYGLPALSRYEPRPGAGQPADGDPVEQAATPSDGAESSV
ncbi:MAG: sulfite exporter TauE/SafE family protein [Actinomycetes bacterium]